MQVHELVAASFPGGPQKPPQWHGPFRGELPESIPHVDVIAAEGRRRYVALRANALLWLCHRDEAIEFHSWTPTPHDAVRLRFARILLETDSAAEIPALTPAATILREILGEAGVGAIPLVSGATGIATWIPFADAPEYPPVRAWLHEVCNEAVRRAPRIVTNEPNSHAGGRVHLHVGSNAPGRYSALPYSLRGTPSLDVCTPIRWEELATVKPGVTTAANFEARWNAVGEIFGPQAEVLHAQRFARARTATRTRNSARSAIASCSNVRPAMRTSTTPTPSRRASTAAPITRNSAC
ncbi:MAG TPA: hypothetical protein VIN40_07525 [Candidatus Tyrphobacter sp.]